MGKLELIFETEKLSIYSPKYDGETQTEFEKFLDANRKHVHPQLKACFGAILSAIEMGRMRDIFVLKVVGSKLLRYFIIFKE